MSFDTGIKWVWGIFVWNADSKHYQYSTALKLFKSESAADKYVKRVDPNMERNLVVRNVWIPEPKVNPKITPAQITATQKIRQAKKDKSKYTQNKPRGVKGRWKENHPPVKIYGRCLRIEAQKTQPHLCDTECKRVNHRYYHDFRVKNAVIYGMPDGSLKIVSRS